MRTRTAIVLLATLGLTRALSRSGCLCTSDQPCWPPAETFSRLESQLSRPLVYPRPTSYPCYPPSHPSGNCTTVNDDYGDGVWRSSHPGSMSLANWETFTFPNDTIDACYLNTSVTGVCGQGNVPTIGVDARTVADVQTALGFAVEHGLKVVVKSTGHDFVGRSAGRGAFQIWVHHMKNMSYDPTFVPQGAPPNETYDAVTLGGGAQWRDAYELVLRNNRMIVGGISAGASVGACGGWLAGGGHSFLSPSYGLGVDNAVEISVVLSTGEYLTTNAYQNSDLFWALRGGGGGTFGVVTSVTYRTYPIVPFQLWSYEANVTDSSAMLQLVEGFLRFLPQHTSDGWGGYGGINGLQFNFGYYGPGMTNETVKATTQGWINFTESLAPHGVVSSNTYDTATWSWVVSQLTAPNDGENGGSLFFTSRMLTRETIAKNGTQFAEVLVNYGGSFNTIAGGKVSEFAPDSAGLHPAWRDAVTEVVGGVSWDEGDPYEVIQNQTQQLKAQIKALHDVAPNDAAYLNEASPFEIDWQQTFFGAHYPRLKNIKDKYDPYRLFAVREGVGSDDWNQNLTCRY